MCKVGSGLKDDGVGQFDRAGIADREDACGGCRGCKGNAVKRIAGAEEGADWERGLAADRGEGAEAHDEGMPVGEVVRICRVSSLNIIVRLCA